MTTSFENLFKNYTIHQLTLRHGRGKENRIKNRIEPL